MKGIPYISLFLLFITTLIGLISCKNTQGDTEQGKIKVATSIEPLASLVRDIADSNVVVYSLLPEGYSAENYEPSTSDIKKISSSNIYFAIGDLGFETSRLEKLKNINPRLKFVQLGENFCPDHSSHYADPHIWTSPRGVRSIASTIASNLSDIDTANRVVYNENLHSLEREIDSLKQNIKQKLSNAEVKGFVIYHPSLSDYANEFGLTQLAIEKQGKEPNPKQLSELIDRAKKLGVKVVFVQKEFNSSLSNTIANELGAKIYEINPLGKSPIKEIGYITDCLVK